MEILVTGCNGLVGGEAVLHYDRQGHVVYGIDNNMRREFFGPAGDTMWNLSWLKENTKRFVFMEMDIRCREKIDDLFRKKKFDLIVHCAAQPSHDKSAEIPLIDFEVNALATLYLLEATRRWSPKAVFILMSTNKVYGDAPNEFPLVETETRYDYARPEDFHGIGETLRIDRSVHSVFGASKVAADVMVQEYGRYYGLQTGVFRAGCITGSRHSGVELHGFVSYLIKTAVVGHRYSIYGYKGKQVRDQIHCSDLVGAFDCFAKNPRPGEVYNIGGGRDNSASVLETIRAIEDRLKMKMDSQYVDQPRRGDHICYITDTRKFRSHYADWKSEYSLDRIYDENIAFEKYRRGEG
ncbi:MAG TPA: NAD-dependent epimerase/dehydratase family protein [Elusimicrobiota bacterium]|nr:NAD-dependent epimerase/dehydratase family protein [Elusimicrobiota bacterium]